MVPDPLGQGEITCVPSAKHWLIPLSGDFWGASVDVRQMPVTSQTLLRVPRLLRLAPRPPSVEAQKSSKRYLPKVLSFPETCLRLRPPSPVSCPPHEGGHEWDGRGAPRPRQFAQVVFLSLWT